MSTAAASKTPLSRVKEEFGGKDKLVDKIVGILETGEDESKDELRKRLLGVANSKLIRLHGVATRTKAAGGHDKLAATAAEHLKHAKDKDFVEKLSTFSNGRLLDIVGTAAERRSKDAKPVVSAAERKATRRPKVEKPAAKKAAAKKPAAKKPARGGKSAGKKRR
jgi:hypothetical protein